MGELNTHHLTIHYEGMSAPILEDISITFKSGEMTALLGPSGSGKSSLLRALIGLQKPSEGKVCLGETNIHQLTFADRARSCAFVSQSYQLFPHMTVLENCAHAPCYILKDSKKRATDKALFYLKKLGLAELRQRYPHQLSGGQQQRVAIARALSMGARILLLDEPTSALDSKSTEALTYLLRALCDEGITVVASTHDTNFVSHGFDNIVTVEKGKLTLKISMHTRKTSS